MPLRTALSDQLRSDGTPVALQRVSLDSARLLLTPEEVAQVLAIGRSKVYDLLRSEEVSSIRIGGSRRIPVSALHEFVDRLRSVQSAHRH
ncbi:MAG: helix-turn-helix domain-containing protein [Acidimicrobiales bacterium]|jgi:excisionase family DNA binding protein